MILRMGFGEVILCGSKGPIYDGAPYNNPEQQKMAEITNRGMVKGSLADAMKGADILIGVSKPGIVSQDMIVPWLRSDRLCHVQSGTGNHAGSGQRGRSCGSRNGTFRFSEPGQQRHRVSGDFPRCAGCESGKITEEMKEAAARAIAGLFLRKSFLQITFSGSV